MEQNQAESALIPPKPVAPKVLCTVPVAFTFQAQDHSINRIPFGIGEYPEEWANSAWFKAHGVELYIPKPEPVPLTEAEQAALIIKQLSPDAIRKALADAEAATNAEAPAKVKGK